MLQSKSVSFKKIIVEIFQADRHAILRACITAHVYRSSTCHAPAILLYQLNNQGFIL